MFCPRWWKAPGSWRIKLLISTIYWEQSGQCQVSAKGKILMATVKGMCMISARTSWVWYWAVIIMISLDMGVMVPADNILKQPLRRKWTSLGHSLITPFTWWMVHVASEMQTFGTEYSIDCGATTSKHTAVKVEPKYSNGVLFTYLMPVEA